MEQNVTNIDFSKGNGIVPVIVQDANTNEVLTLAIQTRNHLSVHCPLVTLGFGVDLERNYG